MRPEDDKSGPPLGPELAERKARWHVNVKRWMEGQGAKIRDARPEPVYAACLLMMMGRARRSDFRHLTPEQIKICEMRALSTARVKMFGNLPATNEAWDEQLAQVRVSWEQPKQAAA